MFNIQNLCYTLRKKKQFPFGKVPPPPPKGNRFRKQGAEGPNFHQKVVNDALLEKRALFSVPSISLSARTRPREKIAQK